MDNYRHSLKSGAILISMVCSVSFSVMHMAIPLDVSWCSRLEYVTYPSNFSCCVVIDSKLYFGFISVTIIMSVLLSDVSSICIQYLHIFTTS